MFQCLAITQSNLSIDRYGVVANPGRVQLNRENVFFSLSPFAHKKLVSRSLLGCSRPVSTPLGLNLVLLMVE